jgi:hypothetical protein
MARKIIPFTKPECPGIFCEASSCVLEEAAKDGVKTYVQRMEERAIQPCLFGQGGTCCRNCSFGPCMMIEDVAERQPRLQRGISLGWLPQVQQPTWIMAVRQH